MLTIRGVMIAGQQFAHLLITSPQVYNLWEHVGAVDTQNRHLGTAIAQAQILRGNRDFAP